MSDADDVAAALSLVVELSGPPPQEAALGDAVREALAHRTETRQQAGLEAWRARQQARLDGLPTHASLIVTLEVAHAAIGAALDVLREGE